MTRGSAFVTGCHSCEQERHLDAVPDRERVWVGDHWRAAHAFATSLPGWLVVVPRRHTTHISEHSPAEAVELGLLLVAASTALEEVTGCAKTYVAQFAEAEGFSHTHFHVVPRPADLPTERRGPGVFWYLSRPDSEHVAESARDELALRLREGIGRALEGPS